MIVRRNKILESDAALLHRAAQWPNDETFDTLTPGVLREITLEEGIDFATALLFDRIKKSQKHCGTVRRIDSLRRSRDSAVEKLDTRVVIVPGALYVERPDMGGDGHLIRNVAESFGCKTDLIPTVSSGSVKENAALISRWLKDNSSVPFVLISLSKGSADLKVALASPGSTSWASNVLAWISVCGPLNGSRMSDWILASRWRTLLIRLQFLVQRRDFRFITDLRAAPGSLLSTSGSLPRSLKILNVIGFPLRRHFTSGFSRFCHRTLSAYGPNDGTTLLADLRSWPGEIYPAWGMDHYFRPHQEAQLLVSALLRYLAEELEPLSLAQLN